jgi:hypothetical protein
MSSTLFWEPPPKEVKARAIGLKYEIARYFDPEWNGLSADFGLVGDELIPFLKGIIAVGSDGDASDAKELIAAIKKHGQIQLYIRS